MSTFRIVLTWIGFVTLMACASFAQTPTPPTTPTLTEVQRLQLQTVSQRIELAQLRAQAAQVEYDKARNDLQALLKSLQKDGYTLDLQTLTYTKNAEKKGGS